MERSTKPDWKYWNACETLKVWEAVALSIDRDPSDLFTNRNPKNAQSDAYVRRLAKIAGLADPPMRFSSCGEDFLKRLELVRRAIALRPDDLLAFPTNPYNGFKEAHDLHVRPSAIRQFFLDRQHGIPVEWVAAEQAQSAAAQVAQSPPVVNGEPTWVKKARQIAERLKRENPSRPQKWLAARVLEQLKEDRAFARGGKLPADTTVIRHAIRGLK